MSCHWKPNLPMPTNRQSHTHSAGLRVALPQKRYLLRSHDGRSAARKSGSLDISQRSCRYRLTSKAAAPPRFGIRCCDHDAKPFMLGDHNQFHELRKGTILAEGECDRVRLGNALVPPA